MILGPRRRALGVRPVTRLLVARGGGSLLSLAHGLPWLPPACRNPKAGAWLRPKKTFAMPVYISTKPL